MAQAFANVGYVVSSLPIHLREDTLCRQVDQVFDAQILQVIRSDLIINVCWGRRGIFYADFTIKFAFLV